MKGTLVNALIAINALLLGAFVLTVFNCARQGDASPREPEPGAPILSSVPAVHRAAAEGSPRPRDEMERASSLPFQQLYSADVRQFAANLRTAGCPEETVRDIVVAEVQALQERTQGFWEPADIAELERLKAERSAFIDAVLDDRQWTEFKLHTEPAVAGFQKQLAMAEVNEDEMRALLLAARERGISDLGAALSGGPESTELLSAALGDQRATELSRLQREPELRRFYGDLKAMGVEGEFIPPRLPDGYPPYRTATPQFRGALPSAARDHGHGVSTCAGGRSDRVCHEPCPSAAGSGGRGEASSQANRAAPARGVGSGPGVIRNLECERRAAPFAGTIAGL